jgi:hypothetical protein
MGQKSTSIVTRMSVLLLAASLILIVISSGSLRGDSLTVAGPYTVSVFATGPAGSSNPDSIAVGSGVVFIGYGNTAPPDGSSGTSTIAEYNFFGQLLKTYTVQGHNDGLRFDPSGTLWAMQNEDANPYLAIINPATGNVSDYTFGPTPHGGGYDDIQFLNGKTYISASNPTLNAQGLNTGPALVSATTSGTRISVSGVVQGNAVATNIETGVATPLNLDDPDSLTITPSGSLLLDSQDTHEVLFINNPDTPSQTLDVLPIMWSKGSTSVDDTQFISSGSGELLVSSTGSNTVYAIHSNSFVPGTAFSASDSSNFVGMLNTNTGVLTPILSGLDSPHGEGFIPGASPVSEPSSAVLMVAGALSLLLLALRKGGPLVC